jgi:GrpB-like predicted nucleotidyltransferase (UPF0157 family)
MKTISNDDAAVWLVTTEDTPPKTCMVGEPVVLNGRIELQDYSPDWAKKFEQQNDSIRRALGESALRIEHVGSTAVPGLCAKPIIDVLLVVRDSAAETSYVPPLEAAGYLLRIREPDWHEHRMFNCRGIAANLHVFSAGSTEIERLLILRDRLRENPEERRLYAETKRRLASQRWKYTQDYADAKSEVIEGILQRGRRE